MMQVKCLLCGHCSVCVCVCVCVLACVRACVRVCDGVCGICSQYIQYYTTEDVQSKYNIHFIKETKPIIVEWETPTKTNLTANTNVNVNILANVLVCTYTSAK